MYVWENQAEQEKVLIKSSSIYVGKVNYQDSKLDLYGGVSKNNFYANL